MPKLTLVDKARLQRLEAELESLKKNVVMRAEQLASWRRQNTAKILLVGGLGGSPL